MARAKRKKKVRLSPSEKLLARLVSELCYFYSLLQSHNAKLIKILEDKGVVSRPDLEGYAQQFPVSKYDSFHLVFCEKKLRELGVPDDKVAPMLEDIRRLPEK